MSEVLEFSNIESEENEKLLPFAESVHAGFPSPAEDIFDGRINLNKELISNPNATFFARVKGNSMIEEGIEEGDVLIIDKSKEVQSNTVAVCYIDGEFTVKKVLIENEQCFLVPANPEFKRMEVTEENNFVVWGVVTYIIKKL